METVSEAIIASTRLLHDRGIETARLDAEVLLAHSLRCDRVDLLRNPERILTQEERLHFRNFVERRLRFEPVSYISGKKEFYSLEFEVGPSVMVPRPETELLVELALKRLGRLEGKGEINFADIGTGSGAITASILANSGFQVKAFATDISKEALETAKKNIIRICKVPVTFVKGDLFEGLAGKFDLLVSNPPYVESGEIERLMADVRLFEPALALDGGEDGLKIIRRLLKDGIRFLKDKGTMIIEFGLGQKDAIEKIDSLDLYGKSEFHRDLSGRYRVLSVTR